MENVVNILEKLVSYDTRTWKDTPGKEVEDVYKEQLIPILDKFDFKTEIIESNGHFSILAERDGNKPSILYSGHVDVVPWDDRWDTDPQELVRDDHQEFGEILRGRGVSDMKSGVAAIFSALEDITKSDNHLLIAITGDEEIAGENGTKVIVDKLRKEDNLPDYVITADANGMEVITRRRNVFNITVRSKKSPVKIKGKRKQLAFETKVISSDTSHAAYFDRKKDEHCVKVAAEKLKDQDLIAINVSGNFVSTNVVPNNLIIDVVEKTDNGEDILADEGLTYLMEFARQVMEIEFETEAESSYGINSTVNLIEDKGTHWELIVDLRAMLSKESDILEDTVYKMSKAIGWNFDFDFFKSIAYIATPDDSPLVEATTAILGELGYNDETAERGGATDGRFFGKYKIPTIDIGALGWNVHGPNETATVQSIKDLVEFFKQSAQRVNKVHLSDN